MRCSAKTKQTNKNVEHWPSEKCKLGLRDSILNQSEWLSLRRQMAGMAQQLKALAVLTEDPESIPSIHMVVHSIRNYSSKVPNVLF